ncbi:hypothetical protein ACH5RR_020788 [Cinchona calisaya]|uniref:Cyclin-dependent protein kinase inhibitor SMR3 n=1 Tax=Cinchona calisaya TaxID=153742 RepID=A0ABD2ZGK3_9GENT
MFLEFNSFSIMGFPDSLEKDLHSMECNFLSRPSLEIKVTPSDDEVNDDCFHVKNQRFGEFYCEEKQEKEDRKGVLVSCLKIKLPKAREEEEEEEGCTTPTSVDQQIPPQVCPPAPRKPKSVPSSTTKGSRRRVLLDLSNEVESLFPPALLADFGKKIKKIRKEI